ncbi:putative lysosomal acid lipase/cholesteryl ester hydrolase isoform X2 [Podarcis muralis]
MGLDLLPESRMWFLIRGAGLVQALVTSKTLPRRKYLDPEAAKNTCKKSGKFKGFDWGSKEENMAHHNQETAPSYEIKQMTIPTALWSSGNDLLSTPKDVAWLLPQVPNLFYHKFIPDWEHMDFFLGLDAPQRLYEEIIEFMQNYE